MKRCRSTLNDGAVLSDWEGTGIHLLVDDEESILATGNWMLERLEFQVLTAADVRRSWKLIAPGARKLH